MFQWFTLFRFQVLILLDVTPDQSMLDEGVAREIVNRIQRLRKKVPDQVYNYIFFQFLVFFSSCGWGERKMNYKCSPEDKYLNFNYSCSHIQRNIRIMCFSVVV